MEEGEDRKGLQLVDYFLAELSSNALQLVLR